MIAYQHFILDNGLNVFVIENPDTPIAAMNILYNVGSRDEDENRTGFAHLFEHLMFGGSKNIPNYDEPLQKVGGENNAFTSPDITNYYLTLPYNNIETGFWLESDRMLSLSFDPQVLEIQQKVVIEEFKQRYLNQPYGDVWLKLRPLAYKKHPYRWATIGKDISHIENATLENVKDFFFKFYRPNNATLVVAGNVKTNQIKQLAKKWFGPIPAGEKYVRNLIQEPLQTALREMDASGNVPLNSIYKVFHMPGKTSTDYYAADLMGDALGRGQSSRLFLELVKKNKLFNKLSAYVTGSLDPGLLVVSGMMNNDVTFDQAEDAIQTVIDEYVNAVISEEELMKVRNQAESTLLFSEVDILHQAMNLAAAANMGQPDLINNETSLIQNVDRKGIQSMAKTILKQENCSTLRYHAKH